MPDPRQNSFSLSIDEFIRKVGGNAEEVTRKATMSVFSGIVFRTPVDTGRARGAWQLQPGALPAPRSTVLDQDGSATVARGLIAAGTFKLGETIYIENPLPYAVPLEYGYSQQAPIGMVRVVVREWDRYVAAAVASLPQ